MTWIYLPVTAACMGYAVGTSRLYPDMPQRLFVWGAVVLGIVAPGNVWVQTRSWVAAAVAGAVWLAIFVAVYRPARAGKLSPGGPRDRD